MREILIGESTGNSESGKSFTCTYHMLISESSVPFSCESYGVSVTLKQTGETVCIPDITVNAPRIEQLIALLHRNTALPCTIADIVDDWL